MSRIGQAAREARRVTRTHYPGFLFGAGVPAGVHYAFVYHDVDPDVFRRDLEFLALNGYATLGIDEFAGDRRQASDRPGVLLTFDDARRNFWDVAYPLLEEFEARATLFVPTQWIDDDDYGASARFMTWKQLRACDRSSLVDVESHAHRHALISTGNRVVAWATPEAITNYDVYEWPLRVRDGEEELGPPPLGSPIYPARPLLSAERGMLDNRAVTEACQNVVAASDPEMFFADRGWRDRLADAHKRAAAESPPVTEIGRDALESLVDSEFSLSRREFELHLGRPPRYLAYPWHLGSTRSLAVAAGHGIEAVFGVGLDFRRARDISGPPVAFGRLKGDWLRFLPGDGRRRLHTVLWEKLGRMAKPKHLSH